MLKPTIVPLVFIHLLLVGFLETAQCQTPVAGTEITAIKDYWVTEGYGAVIAIDSCADRPTEICGKLVWAWDEAALKPGSVGRTILTQAVYDGERWRGAKLTNPEDGRRYRGRLELLADGRLAVEGCALIVCREQIWWRLDQLPRPQFVRTEACSRPVTD